MKDVWIEPDDIDGMVGLAEFALPRNWIAVEAEKPIRRPVDPGAAALR